MRHVSAAVLLALSLVACGGGGNGGGGSPSPNPNPSPNPSQNPCSTASLEADAATSVLYGLSAADDHPDDLAAAAEAKKNPLDGSTRWRVLDDLAIHQQAQVGREPRRAPRTAGPPTNSVDIGEIAVIQDEGDLIAPPNSFDLRGVGLRFTRTGNGYDVRRIDANFRQTLGTRLVLTDDDTVQRDVTFDFPFYGQGRRVAWINSDGNITFNEGDKASTERNVSRLLTGPPRVSAFLADLDPSAGGTVHVNATASEYTVTWCAVRGFDSASTITVQTTLLPDGTIEIKYGSNPGLGDAVVGLSPGFTGTFNALDLSANGPTGGGDAAMGERFASRTQLDVVATTRKFYATHPDNYDQLILWTDATVVRDSFAYETTIANEVRGIGIDTYDLAGSFGSAGRMRSLVVMDWIGKYPEDPRQVFLGENSTVSVLGQEVGHRWLAFMEFRDRNGQRSDLLLGRDLAHWSFFFDSDASVMEGNDIEDLGGGSFRTAAAVQRFSRLDQYAMGLVGEGDVPPFFYVENPTNTSPTKRRESAPDVGTTMTGTRREVLIQDIVAIHGPRIPSAAESARSHRQAFIFLVGNGRSPQNADIGKLDRIRREWETFFQQATEGRMRAITTLR